MTLAALRHRAERLYRARIIPALFLTPPYLRMGSLRSLHRWDRIHGFVSLARYGERFTLPIPFTPFQLHGFWRPPFRPLQPRPDNVPHHRWHIARRPV